jgi:hypothetical protein
MAPAEDAPRPPGPPLTRSLALLPALRCPASGPAQRYARRRRIVSLEEAAERLGRPGSGRALSRRAAATSWLPRGCSSFPWPCGEGARGAGMPLNPRAGAPHLSLPGPCNFLGRHQPRQPKVLQPLQRVEEVGAGRRPLPFHQAAGPCLGLLSQPPQELLHLPPHPL